MPSGVSSAYSSSPLPRRRRASSSLGRMTPAELPMVVILSFMVGPAGVVITDVTTAVRAGQAGSRTRAARHACGLRHPSPSTIKDDGGHRWWRLHGTPGATAQPTGIRLLVDGCAAIFRAGTRRIPWTKRLLPISPRFRADDGLVQRFPKDRG